MAAGIKGPTPVNVFEKYLGTLTRYHLYFFFLMSIAKSLSFGHMVNLLFLTPAMKPNCTCPCPEPVWNKSVFTKVIQMKYNVVCDEENLIKHSQNAFYFGTLIGAFCFGAFSDLYGRLLAFTISLQVVAAAGCLTVVMPTMYAWMGMRVIEGIGVGGSIVTGYVLVVEYFGINLRDIASALYHLPVSLGVITIAVISYYLRDCDDFQLALSWPIFGTVFFIFLIEESPKWLLHTRQATRAEKSFKKILKWNKTPTDTIEEDIAAHLDYTAVSVDEVVETVSFWKVFYHKRLTINFFCMSFMYFTCGMGYYGVTQYIGNMSGDPHLNLMLNGCMQIVTTTVCSLLIGKFGRKTWLFLTNSLSGILLVAVTACPVEHHWLRVVLACLGCCMFFMAFIIVFLYGVELFPTCIRNSVLGGLSVISRVGQIVAPIINALPELFSGAIFASCALFAAILVTLLPETRGLELPTTLEEAEFNPVPKRKNLSKSSYQRGNSRSK